MSDANDGSTARKVIVSVTVLLLILLAYGMLAPGVIWDGSVPRMVRIKVVNEAGHPIPWAEIPVPGGFCGVTDARGEYTWTQQFSAAGRSNGFWKSGHWMVAGDLRIDATGHEPFFADMSTLVDIDQRVLRNEEPVEIEVVLREAQGETAPGAAMKKDILNELIKSTSEPLTMIIGDPGRRLLPHREGALRLENGTAPIEVRFTVYGNKDSDAGDAIGVERRIVDDQGRVHVMQTFVTVYAIWDAMCAGDCYSIDSLKKSWHWPDGARLVPLLEGVKVWSDGRDDRFVMINGELYRVREKYYSADLDICVLQAGDQQKDEVRSNTAVLLWKSYVSFQSVSGGQDQPEIIARAMPFSYLLWSNNAVLQQEEDMVYWGHSPMPRPIRFTLTNDRADPNPAVRWVDEDVDSEAMPYPLSH